MFNSLKINYYLAFMERRGIARDEVLVGTDITQAQLLNPNFMANLFQSQKVISNMLALTKSDSLGFEAGREINVSDMGAVGFGLLAAPTYREVLKLWSDFAPLLFGTMIRISVREELDSWSLLIDESLPTGPGYRFCMEEYLMLVIKLNELLRGYPCEYESLSLIYPKPANYREYESLFQCPVKFDASSNRITIKSPRLDEEVLTKDEYVHQIHLDYYKKMAKNVVSYEPYTDKVMQYLVRNLGRRATIKGLAHELGMSTSTLRRNLLAEGTTFRELQAKFRLDFATEYLRTTRMSAKQIGYLLGYEDAKTFLKVFKSWTGRTVSEFRNEYGLKK